MWPNVTKGVPGVAWGPVFVYPLCIKGSIYSGPSSPEGPRGTPDRLAGRSSRRTTSPATNRSAPSSLARVRRL
eukprot:764210-Prorocentrum_minimum.AAC.3